MSDTVLPGMVVPLTGDGSGYQKMLDDAMGATRDFAGQVVSALAGLGTLNILKEALGNFQEAETIGIRLGAVLKSNGRAVQATTAMYKKYAEQREKVSTDEDDAILKLLTVAETYGVTGKAAIKAGDDAANLAALTGGSAASYIRMTASMAKGDIETAKRFARMIPQLRQYTKDTAGFVKKFGELTKTGGEIAKEMVDSSAGGIAVLKRDWGNALEDLGEVVANLIKPFVKGLTELVAWFRQLSPEIKETVVMVMGLVAGFLLLGPAIAGVTLLIGLAFNPLTLVIAGIIVGVIALVKHLGGIEVVLGYVKEAMYMVEFAFKNFGQVASLVWMSIKLSAVQLFNWLVYQFTDVLPTAAEWFGENWVGIFDGLVDLTTEFVENLIDTFANLPALITRDLKMADIWGKFGQGAFKNVKPLVLPERILGPIEAQLRKEFDDAKGALGISYAEFRAKKLEEIGAEAAGDGTDKMADNIEKGKKDAKALESALAGSGEAAKRVADYMERNKRGVGTKAGVGAGGEKLADKPFLGPDDQANAFVRAGIGMAIPIIGGLPKAKDIDREAAKAPLEKRRGGVFVLPMAPFPKAMAKAEAEVRAREARAAAKADPDIEHVFGGSSKDLAEAKARMVAAAKADPDVGFVFGGSGKDLAESQLEEQKKTNANLQTVIKKLDKEAGTGANFK